MRGTGCIAHHFSGLERLSWPDLIHEVQKQKDPKWCILQSAKPPSSAISGGAGHFL